MNNKADIHNQLQALISSCIDEGEYDPAEDYVKDPFCRRTLHTASLAIEEIDTLRARVAELEDAESCLLRHGFTRCSAPACNCGSWHQTSGLAARFEELKDDLEAAGHPLCNKNGHVFRTAIAELVADRDRWKARAAEYKLAHEGSEAVIHMAIARLGGLVEGRPTHRGNFLQRIDELVAMEAKHGT